MEKTNTPFVSIVIPVYNAESYIRHCVTSIVDTKLHNIEVILVDDGSTDTSGAVCDILAKEFTQVRAIHKENCGVASARNVGIESSQGEYIYFVDNDDWVDSNAFVQSVTLLQGTMPDVLFNRYTTVQTNGTHTAGNMYIDASCIHGKSRDQVLTYIQEHRVNVMAPWEYFCKRKILMENNIRFNSAQNGVDDAFFSACVFIASTTYMVGESPVYFWRQRIESQGRTHNHKALCTKLMSVLESFDQLIQKQSTDPVRTYLKYAAYKQCYALVGPYTTYDSTLRAEIQKWVTTHAKFIQETAEVSGGIHKVTNRFLGPLWGTVLSYQLARIKGIIYQYVYR